MRAPIRGFAGVGLDAALAFDPINVPQEDP
jgi:hypothetical protein